MDKVFVVLEIVVPIFVTIFLGSLAKRNQKITEEECKGLQSFVMQFGLPCALFNSCLTGSFGMESLTSMASVAPLVLGSSIWSFRARKRTYRYHNLPLMFSSQETGMLGIPLFMTLFGVEQAYRMGVLDLAQAVIAIPVIAILSADAGENPAVGDIVKKVFQSPLLLMSLLGLMLNLTGAIDALNAIGIGSVITSVTSFIAQPVSAVILFCVGYNFSLGEGNRKEIFKICGLHMGIFAAFCLIIQAIMLLIPSVEPETRWAILIYCTLPGSYLTAGLGKTRNENEMASSVCSVLTIACLVIFCIAAAIVA